MYTSSIIMFKDNCTLLYVVKLPNGLLLLSILTSQQGNYPVEVAGDKKMYLMEKNEDNNGDFVFSEIVGSHPHCLARNLFTWKCVNLHR